MQLDLLDGVLLLYTAAGVAISIYWLATDDEFAAEYHFETPLDPLLFIILAAITGVPSALMTHFENYGDDCDDDDNDDDDDDGDTEDELDEELHEQQTIPEADYLLKL